jgi:hypothetical protein
MTGFKQERDFNQWGDQIFGQRLTRQEVRGRAEPCVCQERDEGYGERNNQIQCGVTREYTIGHGRWYNEGVGQSNGELCKLGDARNQNSSN